MTFLGPSDLKFPWHLYFDRHSFRNFDFLAFLIRIFPFSLSCSHLSNILAFIYWFQENTMVSCWYLLVLYQFGQFFEVSEKSRNPRWAELSFGVDYYGV